MFGGIDLDVLSAWEAIKLTLKVGFICPYVVDDQYRRDNSGCLGLMLVHLQPIPYAENLPFYQW